MDLDKIKRLRQVAIKRLTEKGADDLAQRVERFECLLCGEPLTLRRFINSLAKAEWGALCRRCERRFITALVKFGWLHDAGDETGRMVR